jgi:uncharacterized membrane protein YfcA
MELWLSLLLYFLTGVVSGTFGGLLGIGGSTVLVPALTLAFGIPIHMAIGVSLLNNVAVSTSATARYYGRGLLHGRIILIMNAGSVAGILIGAFLATRSPGAALKVAFGAFLLLMVADAFLRRGAVESDAMPGLTARIEAGLAGLGLVMGMLGAMLGLGGGTVAVPALNNLFKMPLRQAIANSLAAIILSSSLGAIVYFYLSSGKLFSAWDALLTAAAIIPGSIVGARAGAIISGRLHVKYIKYIFYALLLYIAYSMIKSGLGW